MHAHITTSVLYIRMNIHSVGDYNMGVPAVALERFRALSVVAKPGQQPLPSTRHFTMYGALDGSMG